ncbi:MAG: hypothetical protein AAGF83_02785 [Cyanobacteria bacterium P01_G01_bin.67]
MDNVKQMTLKQLKVIVYEQYQVENSRQLKIAYSLAARLDLRYKKSWHLLQENKPHSNIISLANHISSKNNASDILDSGLKSLESDLAAFEAKINSDHEEKSTKSQKYRKSLTYL